MAKKKQSLEDRLCFFIGRNLGLYLPDSVWWTHNPMGENRNAATGGKLKAWHTVAGTPDYLFLYQGRAYFVECKAPKGRLSDNQKIQFPIIEKCGAPIALVRTFDELLSALLSFGIPLKNMGNERNKKMQTNIEHATKTNGSNGASKHPNEPTKSVRERNQNG